jgi:hypothetical protein
VRLRTLLLLLIALVVAARAQEVLTNEKIVSMTKAKLGDKLIVEMIQSNPGKYLLTSTDMIALKQQAVSDAVIAAMRAKMTKKPDAVPARAKAEPTPAPRPSEQPRFGEWQVYDKKDDITGESHVEGFLRERAESNGREGEFQVTATCSALGLAFKIVYLSSFDKDLGYKMEDGNFLLRRPHVVMRLSLDGKSGSAPSTTSNFKNEATLWFQRAMTDAEKKDLGTAVFGGLLSLTSPAEPKEVYQAKILRVELPLNNGDLPILSIRPQEQGFPAFASRCKTADEEGQRNEQEEKAQADATAAKARAEQQKAAAAEFANRQLDATAANDLMVDRDLGNALLCTGTLLYAHPPTLSSYSSSRKLDGILPVKIVGASVKDGVLWSDLRVKPITDRPVPALISFGLGQRAFFVQTNAIQDHCPDYQPRAPGFLSNVALADGVRAAGSLDAWSKKLAMNADALKASLEAAAIPAEEFPAALTASLDKRSGEFGVNPPEYETAIKTIADIVTLCSSISPSAYASSKDQYGTPHLVRYQEGKYKSCVETGVWRGVPEAKDAPGFLISFSLENRWQSEKAGWDGPKLHMDVYLKETKPVTPPISIAEYQRRYILLSVDIRDRGDSVSAGSQVAPPASPSAGEYAVLTVRSGFPSRPGAPNLLSQIPYKLMRDDFATTLNKAGIRVHPGTQPKEALSAACVRSESACTNVIQASVANPAGSILPAANGTGTFPGVPPGIYYLMIYAYDYNHRNICWNLKLDLKSGPNIITIGQANAVLLK